jgi:hypothetical protein
MQPKEVAIGRTSKTVAAMQYCCSPPKERGRVSFNIEYRFQQYQDVDISYVMIYGDSRSSPGLTLSEVSDEWDGTAF